MFPGVVTGLLMALAAFGQSSALSEARKLYQRTQYEQAIRLLEKESGYDSALLQGQSWFQMGEFKKATDSFEKAAQLAPQSSEAHLWLGRGYGRRAETANPLMAPRWASRTRQAFEKAVELDPKNVLAMNDLFEYYLQAPGFLGGGKEKADALAKRIAALDPAEGHFAIARMAEDRKEFSAAEQQLRRAVEAAPAQVGRVLDLAKFLAKQGRVKESEAEFQRAEKLAPNSPKVMFERAATYVQTRRNPAEAKNLLQRYLKSELTPDDPPRQEAEKLLRELGA